MPPSNATDHTFRDTSRQRDIPARIYEPACRPLGLILFSHGLGGTRESYRYLGEAWSAHGYRVAHVQHPGSDASIFAGTGTPREKARRGLRDPANWHNRPLDASLVLDELGWTGPVGVAGHSMGAATALALLGMTIAGQSYRDPRVQAAVVMSAPPADAAALTAIASPVFHLTGSRDQSPLAPATAEHRTACFRLINTPNQWSLVIPEAHHFTFSDNPVWAGQRIERDPAHQPWIATLGARFFDACLRDDPAARHWLSSQPGIEHK